MPVTKLQEAEATRVDGNIVQWGFDQDAPTWIGDSLELSIGKKRSTDFWKITKSTYGEFIGSLSSHSVGHKDGSCFMQGTLVKNNAKRTRPSVRDINIMALDIDHGAPIEEILQRIWEEELFAVVYTSHSHMKPKSMIPRDALVRHYKLEDVEEIDDDLVKDYLRDVKGYDERIIETCSIVKIEQQDQGGVQVEVSHKPMPKYRVVFFLEEPVKPNMDFITLKEGEEFWKKKYAGLADLLGTHYDKSCTDISRLFYFPRHPKGGQYEVHIMNGWKLNLSEIEDGDISNKSSRKPIKNTGIDHIDKMAKNLGLNDDDDDDKSPLYHKLKRFAAKHGDHFHVSDYLETFLEVRSERSEGKMIFECPFDFNHSNAGDEEDMGFCSWNPDSEGNSEFKMACQHDSCHDHDRLDFLCQAMEEQGHEINDLMEFVYGEGSDSSDSTSSILREMEKELKEEVNELSNDDRVDASGEELSEEELELKVLIERLKDNQDDDTIRAVCYSLASMFPKALVKQKWLGKIVEASGKPTSLIKSVYKEEARNAADDMGDVGTSDPEISQMLKRMNKEFAVVIQGQNTLVFREIIDRDGTITPSFMTVRAFKDFMSNRRVRVLDDSGEYKKKCLADLWLEYPKRRDYEGGVVFDPHPSAERVSNQYNLWRGWHVKSKKEGNWDQLFDHIYNNVCLSNDDYYDYLMSYFAHIVQCPWELPGVAIVIQGQKGTGKSKLLDDIFVNHIFKGYALKTSRIESILGNFNEAIRGKTICVLEEAFWGGDKSKESSLKDMITSNTQEYRVKYQGSEQIKNYMRIVCTSNEEFVVPATHDERRFFVLEVSDRRRKDFAYFAELDRQLYEEGGLESFMWELENWPEPDEGWKTYFGRVPQTPFLKHQIVEALPIWEKNILECFQDGMFEASDRLELEELIFKEDAENVVKHTYLRKHWQFFARSRPHQATGPKMNKFIEKVFGITPNRNHNPISGRTEYAFNFPPLSKVRECVTNYYGQNMYESDPYQKTVEEYDE